MNDDRTVLPYREELRPKLARRFAESQAPSYVTDEDDLEGFYRRHQDAYDALAHVALSFLAEQLNDPTPWPCSQNKGCPCYYGLGGACKCEHSTEDHDDCCSGVIHCHGTKQANDHTGLCLARYTYEHDGMSGTVSACFLLPAHIGKHRSYHITPSGVDEVVTWR